jgi:uroporphyrin-III C-methyltransferase
MRALPRSFFAADGSRNRAQRAAKVYLVGAGPGDPELLTVKATRILAGADVVLHDSLVSAEILALIPCSTLRIDVGKRCGAKLLTQEEINELLVMHAGSSRIVVRLKGGDPGIFGRAGEEIDALLAAGIEFEIIPGITASLAAAAGAKISLTDRRIASNLLLTTLHRRDGMRGFTIDRVPPNTTVAIYMPGGDYAEVARALEDAGIRSDTPCALVASASSSGQQVLVTSVAALPRTTPLPAPTLLIVGHVVSTSAFIAGAHSWRKFADDASAQPKMTSA